MTAPITRERTWPQEVAAFILNEVMRDYNRLGYFPVSSEVMARLLLQKRAGTLTRTEMLDRYRTLAGRPT